MDLESYRRSRGLTQEQVAQALGLRSKGYISDIEGRRQRCSLRLALRIQQWSEGAVPAASLNTDAADLLPRPSEAPR